MSNEIPYKCNHKKNNQEMFPLKAGFILKKVLHLSMRKKMSFSRFSQSHPQNAAAVYQREISWQSIKLKSRGLSYLWWVQRQKGTVLGGGSWWKCFKWRAVRKLRVCLSSDGLGAPSVWWEESVWYFCQQQCSVFALRAKRRDGIRWQT